MRDLHLCLTKKAILFLTLFIILIPPAALGNFTPLSRYIIPQMLDQIGGATIPVKIQGDFAYIGIGGRLVIVNISTPESPVIVGQSSRSNCTVGDIALSNNYAYVLCDGLQIFDISNKSSPTQVGRLEIYASKILVEGNFAYLSTTSGLSIVDVSNPNIPEEIGSSSSHYYARGLDKRGDYVYLIDDPNVSAVMFIQVVDVSDPYYPYEVGYSLAANGNPYDIVVDGNYAYVAAYSKGLQIFSISNPTNPTHVKNLEFNGISIGVDKSGDDVYLSQQSRLRAIDVSDPNNPFETDVWFGGALDTAFPSR